MERYFAAANSSAGFVNFYPQCFGSAERIYIIKGGPGTGKSSFMRRASRFAEGAGWKVRYFLCSSDPDWLDGILMEKEGRVVGMLDGTSPHEFSPEIIGAREEYVDLGRFWSRGRLTAQKSEISAIMKKKKAAFDRAYTYLRACGNLTAVIDSLVLPACDRARISCFGTKLLSRVPVGTKYSCDEIFTDSVGMKGSVTLDTFTEMADDTVYLPELYGIEYALTEALACECKKKELSVKLSHSPIYPQKIDGIFIENARLAFVIRKGTEKSVNLRRFLSNMTQADKKEVRYATRLRSECEQGAIFALSEAREEHFKIEEIYKSAMDFAALNAFSEEFFEDFLNI